MSNSLVNEIGINYSNYTYKDAFKNNNIILDLDIQVVSFESFVNQRNNFILGIKIFYTNYKFFEISWNFKYRAIAGAIIENELEGSYLNFFPEKIILNNGTYIWTFEENNTQQEKLNMELLNNILNSEGSCKIYGSPKYIDYVSQNMWFIEKNKKIYFEDEINRQKKNN